MNKGGICFVKAYLDANDTFYNFLSLPLANYYIGGLGEVEIELSGKFAGKEHGCVFTRVKLLLANSTPDSLLQHVIILRFRLRSMA